MKKFELKQWIFFFAGIAIFVLGIFSIFSPIKTVLVTTTIVAGSMFVKGLLNVISFFKQGSGSEAGYSGLSLFGAIIDILFGVILLMNRDTSAIVLCLLVGFWFLFSSVFQISRSFEYKKLGVKSWWVSFLFSVISTILAFFVIGNPVFGGVVITYFVAIALMSTGLLVIADSFNN